MRRSTRQTKLILQRHVPNLGEPGDIVSVKPGYARNYLIPKGLGVPATEANINMVMSKKDKLEEMAEADKERTRQQAAELEGLAINVKRKVAEGDTLYGSVSITDIHDALEAEGHEIPKDGVLLPHAIKTLGVHEVPLRLRHGIETSIKVWVVAEEEEPGVAPAAVGEAADMEDLEPMATEPGETGDEDAGGDPEDSQEPSEEE